ncbi:MAG: tRNA lysidine(34) synthetase TilS [Verrucomicrobia bacterium]|nr:tRNA lysidine(34) synthetase TilS [Verrucomicrobiota bacterium]
MSDLPIAINETVRRLKLFEPRQSILVAVSGGIDSMALLYVLNRLAPEHAWRLVVAHFNHRLRGRASDADEAFVRKSAKALGLAFASSGADVKRFARRHKLSVEMAARKLRHDFFARTCSRFGIRTVALAHHADDQVELFFLRLLRGAGGEGLAGMDWISPSPSDPRIHLVRPFLNVRKEELRAFAQEQDIAHREDATNAALEHQRNRIRHELLPLLRVKYQPALAKIVPRVMEIIREESDFVTRSALAWLAENGPVALAELSHERSLRTVAFRPLQRSPAERARKQPEDCGPPGLRFMGDLRRGDAVAGGFELLPVAVQRRIMHLELARLGVAPEFELIERLRGSVGEIISVNSILAIWRDGQGRLQFRRPTQFHFDSNTIWLNVAEKRGHADFDGLKVAWQIEPWKHGTDWRQKLRGQAEQFDARKVGSPIILRHWRPGDRFQPIGLPASVKVQDLLTNAKIPRSRRHRLVLATTPRREIFWIEDFRISERFKVTRHTTSCLRWAWQRARA